LYTLGNPLKYVDPSGHFADEEILGWLKEQYPDSWESIWEAWQQDSAWMDLLHTAQLNDRGGYYTDERKIQWFIFGANLWGGKIDYLHDDNITGAFSLVDLHSAIWATGVLRKNTAGGFDVLQTERFDRSLHIIGYVSVDNLQEARRGHHQRAGFITLGNVAFFSAWSPLAEAGWAKFLGMGEKTFKAFKSLVAAFTWFVNEETDLMLSDAGCSVGDEAVYFEVLWGERYVSPDGKPLLWWGGRR
jgi:hypothetical protein